MNKPSAVGILQITGERVGATFCNICISMEQRL